MPSVSTVTAQKIAPRAVETMDNPAALEGSWRLIQAGTKTAVAEGMAQAAQAEKPAAEPFRLVALRLLAGQFLQAGPAQPKPTATMWIGMDLSTWGTVSRRVRRPGRLTPTTI